MQFSLSKKFNRPLLRHSIIVGFSLLLHQQLSSVSLFLAIYIGLFLNLSVFIRRFDILHLSSSVGHMIITLTNHRRRSAVTCSVASRRRYWC
ncbi:MAG: hypothetical protein GPOALKHO_001748 [Sodalis sp.]|uniref:hypothetical protein n=1 Tax=Sodalis sp. (in: enterobacteria) TaxID=1898979 RepID=UPI003873C62A|nr:MAG: hypothetical protein GPOALKHO_001748 [Sodalis sp.]